MVGATRQGACTRCPHLRGRLLTFCASTREDFFLVFSLSPAPRSDSAGERGGGGTAPLSPDLRADLLPRRRGRFTQAPRAGLRRSRSRQHTVVAIRVIKGARSCAHVR